MLLQSEHNRLKDCAMTILSVPMIIMSLCRPTPAPDRPEIHNMVNLCRHIIVKFLNPFFRLRIQPIDKVSESRHSFLNSQIAISLGPWRGDA